MWFIILTQCHATCDCGAIWEYEKGVLMQTSQQQKGHLHFDYCPKRQKIYKYQWSFWRESIIFHINKSKFSIEHRYIWNNVNGVVKMPGKNGTRLVNISPICQMQFRLYTVTMLFCATLDISLDICSCRSLISMGRLFSSRHLISRKGSEPYSSKIVLGLWSVAMFDNETCKQDI